LSFDGKLLKKLKIGEWIGIEKREKIGLHIKYYYIIKIIYSLYRYKEWFLPDFALDISYALD